LKSLHSQLSYKRLERGRFLWPSLADGVVTISVAQLRIRKYRAALIEESRGRAELVSFDLADKLDKLERYERRAFARRNKALRAIEG
jgi:transposase